MVLLKLVPFFTSDDSLKRKLDLGPIYSPSTVTVLCMCLFLLNVKFTYCLLVTLI